MSIWRGSVRNCIIPSSLSPLTVEMKMGFSKRTTGMLNLFTNEASMKLPAEPESRKAEAAKEILADTEIRTGTVMRGEEVFTPSNASPTLTRCERFPDAVDEEDSPLESAQYWHSTNRGSRLYGGSFLAWSSETDPPAWLPRREAQKRVAVEAGR